MIRRAIFTAVFTAVAFASLAMLAPSPSLADYPVAAGPGGTAQRMHITFDESDDYFNPDGSCVLLSMGMVGRNSGNMNVATLPFDTCYGPAERGGAWPSRVANICNARRIKAWNVTGSTSAAWIDYAIRTGRFAAIGAGQAHFQTASGWNPVTNQYEVLNNQTPRQIDLYTRDRFLRLHYESGPWCVVLQQPTSTAPEPVKWWD